MIIMFRRVLSDNKWENVKHAHVTRKILETLRMVERKSIAYVRVRFHGGVVCRLYVKLVSVCGKHFTHVPAWWVGTIVLQNRIITALVQLVQQAQAVCEFRVSTEWSSRASPSGTSASGTQAVSTRSEARPPLLFVLLLIARSVKESAATKKHKYLCLHAWYVCYMPSKVVINDEKERTNFYWRRRGRRSWRWAAQYPSLRQPASQLSSLSVAPLRSGHRRHDELSARQCPSTKER